VAELAIGLLVCLARGIPAHDRAIRAGGTASVGSELRGKTLGIVGAGAIGREVIRLGEAFGMRAIHHDRGSGTPLPELFAESDFVSVHVPLTDETRGMIDRSLLSAMKPTAFLVNTARGPVVDHDNLVTALREGWIAGAALDVFTTEPPIPSDEPLLGFANVIATPHIGFDTAEAVKAKAQLAVQHVVDFTADP
jgi:D-3-phosphoglycerate dehydrogenase